MEISDSCSVQPDLKSGLFKLQELGEESDQGIKLNNKEYVIFFLKDYIFISLTFHNRLFLNIFCELIMHAFDTYLCDMCETV